MNKFLARRRRRMAQMNIELKNLGYQLIERKRHSAEYESPEDAAQTAVKTNVLLKRFGFVQVEPHIWFNHKQRSKIDDRDGLALTRLFTNASVNQNSIGDRIEAYLDEE